MEFRCATPDDAALLLACERAASLAALGHVFPPELYPYPDAEVLARWRTVLNDDATTTLVLDGDDRLQAFVAFDPRTVRHLGVHPDRWGHGLARVALEHAVARMELAPTLWCLTENHRALGLYAHLGWVDTRRRRQAEFPPWPEELQLLLQD